MLALTELVSGIQSLNDDLAKFLGRIHTKEDSINAIRNAQKAGFENINADVLVGVPNQSVDVFMSTLIELANPMFLTYLRTA